MAKKKRYEGPYEARKTEDGYWQVWFVEHTWPTLEQVEQERKRNLKGDYPKPESYWEHHRELAKQKEIARLADGKRQYNSYDSAARRARQLNIEEMMVQEDAERKRAEDEYHSQLLNEAIESM